MCGLGGGGGREGVEREREGREREREREVDSACFLLEFLFCVITPSLKQLFEWVFFSFHLKELLLFPEISSDG